MSSYKTFHIPLSQGDITLKDALAQMKASSNAPGEIPWIVRLVENPSLDFPGIRVFHGAVDLYTHDCIHLILGRGMLPEDEAFVIGFTMGSTNLISKFERFLYLFVTENLYPKAFRFNHEEHMVLDIGFHVGHVSTCQPLDTVDFKNMESLTLSEIRSKIGLEEGVLQHAYLLESEMFPDSVASSRVAPKHS